jgi:cellulose synthase/poly-beta-1,6-N-acetylglucosamine synthase-like glycosyltransferase
VIIAVVSFLLFWILPMIVILVVFKQIPGIQQTGIERKEWPMISVLVAARNEEHSIIRCLEALANQDYPTGNIEILIGNDQSEDQTHDTVAAFIKDKPQFKLFHIEEEWGSAAAKANVLAQLAHQAKGSYFLFTDADIQVNPEWARTMVTASHTTTGVATGVTLVEGYKVFDKLQAIDWCYAMAMIKVLEQQGKPVTAMGNNMIVHREAYFATGGYEQLPPSIVEDLQLFQHIIKKGWGFQQHYDRSVAALSLPVPGFGAWMQQRKRWMKGAMQLSWPLRLSLFSQVAVYPLLLLLFIWYPWAGLLIFAAKALVQWLTIDEALRRLDRRDLRKYVVWYELYTPLMYLTLVVYYFMPTQTLWKGRKY